MHLALLFNSLNKCRDERNLISVEESLLNSFSSLLKVINDRFEVILFLLFPNKLAAILTLLQPKEHNKSNHVIYYFCNRDKYLLCLHMDGLTHNSNVDYKTTTCAMTKNYNCINFVV